MVFNKTGTLTTIYIIYLVILLTSNFVGTINSLFVLTGGIILLINILAFNRESPEELQLLPIIFLILYNIYLIIENYSKPMYMPVFYFATTVSIIIIISQNWENTEMRSILTSIFPVSLAVAPIFGYSINCDHSLLITVLSALESVLLAMVLAKSAGTRDLYLVHISNLITIYMLFYLASGDIYKTILLSLTYIIKYLYMSYTRIGTIYPSFDVFIKIIVGATMQ